MAVVTKSFSIREYTERMRSIDLRRHWLFDDGNEARHLLPSILIRKFKWWGDELDSARSTAIVENEDDPNKDATMAAISEGDDTLPLSGTAMEPSAARTTGEEGRWIANKGKQRTPKKRSIVELFAAAPLIAGTADADDTNSEPEQEEKGRGSPMDGVVQPGALIMLPPAREAVRPEMQRSNLPIRTLDEEEWVTVYGFLPESL